MYLNSYGRFADVPEWPAGRGHNVFLTPGWTRSVEGALGPEQRYLLAYDDAHRLRGSLGAYLVSAETRPFSNPHALLTHHLTGAALQPWRSAADEADGQFLAEQLSGQLGRSAVAMAPFGFTHSLSSDGTPVAREALISGLANLQKEWDATNAAVLYVGEDETDLRAELIAHEYVEALVGANCVMPINFSDFNGYLSTFGTHRRTEIVRERRKFRTAGITIDVEEVDGELDRMAELQARLQEKYGAGYDVDRERAAIASILHAIPEHAHVLVARQGGDLLAFVMFYVKDGVMHAKMGARDVSRAKNAFVYFNTGYYEMIEEALRRGVHEIQFGPEAYKVKLQRGCHLSRLYWYIKIDDASRPLLERAAKIVSGARQGYLEAMSAQ